MDITPPTDPTLVATFTTCRLILGARENITSSH
jgi:hypothetical protein